MCGLVASRYTSDEAPTKAGRAPKQILSDSLEDDPDAAEESVLRQVREQARHIEFSREYFARQEEAQLAQEKQRAALEGKEKRGAKGKGVAGRGGGELEGSRNRGSTSSRGTRDAEEPLLLGDTRGQGAQAVVDEVPSKVSSGATGVAEVKTPGQIGGGVDVLLNRLKGLEGAGGAGIEGEGDAPLSDASMQSMIADLLEERDPSEAAAIRGLMEQYERDGDYNAFVEGMQGMGGAGEEGLDAADEAAALEEMRGLMGKYDGDLEGLLAALGGSESAAAAADSIINSSTREVSAPEGVLAAGETNHTGEEDEGVVGARLRPLPSMLPAGYSPQATASLSRHGRRSSARDVPDAVVRTLDDGSVGMGQDVREVDLLGDENIDRLWDIVEFGRHYPYCPC